MDITLHRAHTRGHFNHGWLDTYHTFSFSEYFDPERVHFGTLRVLNDDTVQPGKGFGMHAHHNMEVISFPISGQLEHTDSLGSKASIGRGQIQMMSAGTGIRHSEYNPSQTDKIEFLQIWILPDQQNVTPRYENISIRPLVTRNQISEIIAPFPGNGKVPWIHQKAWLSYAETDAGVEVSYELKSPFSYGVYIFVISGRLKIGHTELGPRDGAGFSRTSSVKIKSSENAEYLLIEVPPMK